MKKITSSVITNKFGERIDYTYHSGSRRDVLVILGHGVTGNKDRPLLLALADGLSALGWPCMRISFSGNGNSEGLFEDATISKAAADLQAVLSSVPDWVRIVYAGHSMGAAAGVLTAARDLRIRGLVSLAGMARTAEFVEREFGAVVPGDGCMWDDPACPLSPAFVADLNGHGDLLAAAAGVIQPWLFIHGTADDVVPIDDSRDLYAAARGRKSMLEIQGGEHSFDETCYARMVAAIDGWLAENFLA